MHDTQTSVKRFTLTLKPEQLTLLDSLQEVLGASDRSEVIRKALALALLLKQTRDNGQALGILNSDGSVAERIRLL